MVLFRKLNPLFFVNFKIKCLSFNRSLNSQLQLLNDIKKKEYRHKQNKGKKKTVFLRKRPSL